MHSKIMKISFFVHSQGFLTKNGIVNPNRVQMIMQELGKMEDKIFKDRQDRELRFKAMNKAKRRREKMVRYGVTTYISVPSQYVFKQNVRSKLDTGTQDICFLLIKMI